MLRDFFDNLGVEVNHYEEVLWGNTLFEYIEALLLFLLLFFLLLCVRWFILWRFIRYAQKTRTELDDALIDIIKSIKPPVSFFIALYFSIQALEFPALVQDIVQGLVFLAIIYQVVKIIQILLDEVVFTRILKKKMGENQNEVMALGVLRTTSNWLLWILGFLVLVQNFGLNVTSLIAGLGIGGIAFALAAQNILTDLFSSFSILFDKPFEIGDFIATEHASGTVVSIGLKTTKIQSLQGEEIILPNRDIASTQIQNYKRMEERGVIFELGVVYNTTQEQLKNIPLFIEGAITTTHNTRFGRAHLKQLGDSAVIFEVVYQVTSTNYVDYMNAQQEILFKIKGVFDKEKIGIAYPTQTVILEKNS